MAGEGIELSEFADKFGKSLPEIKQLIKDMQTQLSGDNGLHLITYSNKVQLSTNPNYSDQIASVLNPIREKALTKAAMQTLGIIAYKQPITRLEIENIRGVSADYAVQVLLENNMIEVIGRKDVLGKPLLFATTENFLKRFELENLNSLPDYEQLLEQIKLIRTENEIKITETLYKDHEISDDDVLTKDEFKVLSAEEKLQKQAEEELLAQRLKSIDKVIKDARQNTDKALQGKEEETQNSEELSDHQLNQMFEKVMESVGQENKESQTDKLA